MKQLILFRHGKSSWENPGIPDTDRPLISKGLTRTTRMARHLAEKGIKAEMLVTSPAVRAYHTASIVAGILGTGHQALQVDPALYHAGTDRIWDVIISLPDDIHSVMLFGHNPGFTEFINEAGIAKLDWLPTSGAAHAMFNCSHWHECPSTPPENTFILWPAKLK